MADVILRNLVKTYNNGKITALDDISFSVGKGELFGLIGPDGAGKTSIFRILTTLLLPDGGNASVLGFDVVSDMKRIRRCVGYMPGKFSLYQDLTVEENLSFFATVYNTSVAENYELIKDIYFHIEPFRKRRAGQLSGGMKQKLALCCALIHRPEVLFLDEPTTGVDAVSRKEFWEMLKRLKDQRITILVSTPYMDEATMCERIALIQSGKILSVTTPEKITGQYPERLYAVRADNMGLLLKDLRSNEHVATCHTFGEFHHITLKTIGNDVYASGILSRLRLGPGNDNVEIKEIAPTIEDCFMKLMEHPTGEIIR
jgi:ABC-2 type transport system ATP-binding protein